MSARPSTRSAAILFAGALVGACVFPDYDLNDPSIAAGSGTSAGGNAGTSTGGAASGSSAAGVSGGGGAGTGGVSGGTTSGAGGSLALGGDMPGAGGNAGGEQLSGGEAGAGGQGCAVTDSCASSCDNGVQDADEAQIDCGDSAGKCGDCAFAIDKLVIGGESGFSGTAIVTWDATGITVDFTVVDSTPRNDSSEPWLDDAVEIYLDLNGSRTTSYESDDFQIIVPRDESSTLSPQGAANTLAMPVERSSNAAGYKVKINIFWSTLGLGNSPPLGKTIGFDLAIDDDSDGGDRDAQVVAFGTADNFINTSAFGQLKLN